MIRRLRTRKMEKIKIMMAILMDSFHQVTIATSFSMISYNSSNNGIRSNPLFSGITSDH